MSHVAWLELMYIALRFAFLVPPTFLHLPSSICNKYMSTLPPQLVFLHVSSLVAFVTLTDPARLAARLFLKAFASRYIALPATTWTPTASTRSTETPSSNALSPTSSCLIRKAICGDLLQIYLLWMAPGRIPTTLIRSILTRVT